MSRFSVRLSVLAGALVLALNPARADVVTDWNVTALDATAPETPQTSWRVLAMTHGAIFDAMNAVART